MAARRLRSFGSSVALGVALATLSCSSGPLATGVAAQGAPPVPVTAIVERSAVHTGSRLRAALRVEIPDHFHIQSNAPRDPSLIPTVLTFMPPPGVTVPEVVFPEPVDFEILGFEGLQAVFEKTVLIGVTIDVDASARLGRITLPGRFGYQGCDDRSCYPPKTLDVSWTFDVVPGSAGLPPAEHRSEFSTIRFGRGAPPPIAPPSSTPVPVTVTAKTPEEVVTLFEQFEVLGTGAYMTSDEFLTFVRNAETGVKPKGALEGRGPIAILALVFLGGLALNLTPCVLPMIPINLAIIGAGAQNGRRSRGFFLGSVYGAAMALVYGVLGLAVILTAGTFGTINASPWFNVSIAALFVVLGLAMFDIINIDFSRWSSRVQFKQESRGTVWLAFGMGAIAALLAGACVAPVVIQVVVFASERYAAGVPVALALPFVLGLGMALPWPLAGAGLSALPKPGAWMVRVKQAMGVFIIATAAYYGYVAYEGFANRWVDPASVSASVNEKLQAGWTASLPAGLAEASRDKKLVLVDFWATWCKNCLVMDTTTLQDPRVVSAINGYVKIKIQAEDPDAMPQRALLKHIGAVGLPAYAILRSR
jgi:thiol:disulfide interchange protein